MSPEQIQAIANILKIAKSPTRAQRLLVALYAAKTIEDVDAAFKAEKVER